MIQKIEQLLFEKTANTRSKILYSQWQIAKDYVPNILNVICQIFPHYSLHDRTHSDTIINNIGRIVGVDTLKDFSAIDLWLILCSAYYHDIGMAVFANDKSEIFSSYSFSEYIKEIQANKHSTLYDYSMCFEIKDNKVFYKNDELNSTNFESSRFLLAEFIRKNHADRSKDTLKSDFSINLPGSPIPTRIVEILGNICNAHTQSFDSIMALPFCEVGIDAEDCHPRYIACLLRLGDLLDMDSNRFSEVLLQTLATIPIDSIMHKKKHMSITHIRIDKKRIEASAICDDYSVADLTNRWFSYIDQEFYSQMRNWNDIVPDTSYGFLPTLGRLIVDLKDYDTIDGKERPSFKIDPNKSIELLQGAGLYSEPYQSIRELLQNAVDATLLRIFLEKEREGVIISRETINNLYESFPINVLIHKESIDSDEKVEWKIIIKDNGIGMSKFDLAFLTTTGSSNKNNDKKRIIERMPEWLRPSGTFGIGFQSIFLLSEEVKIVTHKINKEDVLYITLHNPSGPLEGAVLIQTKNDESRKIGTDIEFHITTEKDPKRWSVNMAQSFAVKTINTYDFVIDDSLDIDIAKILDEVYKFAQASCFPIILTVNKDYPITLKPDEERPFDYYCEDQGIELSINTSKYRSNTFYRNQIVEKSISSFDYLSFQINILSGNAKDILTLNRNEIQSDYKGTLATKVKEGALYILLHNYSSFDEKIKQYASMFIERYSTPNERMLFNDIDLSSWKKFEIGEDPLKKTIKEILDYDTIVFHQNNNIRGIIVESYKEREVSIGYGFDNEIVTFISIICQDTHPYIIYCNHDKIILSRKMAEIIQDYNVWFYSYLHTNHYSRGLMPCDTKYNSLRLQKSNSLSWAFDDTFRILHRDYPLMICPYIRKYKDNSFFGGLPELLELSISDKLYETVYNNRFSKETTIDEIKVAYQSFVDDMKEIVKSINNKKN